MRHEALGDGPLEPRHRQTMRALAEALDKIFNGEAAGAARTVGFCLMVFPFNDFDGRCNYISNAARGDILIMLKEQVKRFEGRPELKGHA